MTVKELINMLTQTDINPDAPVFFEAKYDEVGRSPVTGMEYDRTEVILTDE